VAAQKGRLELRQPQIDVLLGGVDLLQQLSKCGQENFIGWEEEHADEIHQLLAAIAKLTTPGETIISTASGGVSPSQSAPRPRQLAPTAPKTHATSATSYTTGDTTSS